MTRSVHLRPWQHAALAQYLARDQDDFLAVATPGAGKTTFALTVVRRHLAERPGRVIVVAPTAHLKGQWAAAASRFALQLDDRWSPLDGEPRDMHGIVTTYQQVASAADELGALSKGAIVVLDEVHHAGDERAWGDSVRQAFAGAVRRLSLSGTPFRSDARAIPFVRYEADTARPDYEYGYGDALVDRRVVRPVYFPRTGGHMEWSAPDGSLHAASFEDPLERTRANQRLRTALSLEGQWLPDVLASAHQRLSDLRRGHSGAGGLVIATDQDHAQGVAQLLRDRFRTRAAVAVSDDPDASEIINRFAASNEPWLVAVRMVSEGVDIPRLRVGVFATTTTTELFFRQAVGRLVRWTPGVKDQRAYLFIPDDARLRAHAFQISEARRHSLERLQRAEAEEAADGGQDDQMSLFSVISAVATTPDGFEAGAPDEFGDASLLADDEGGLGDDGLVPVELGAPPPLAGAAPDWAGSAGLTRRQLKDQLRRSNAALARDLARRTGWTHAQVNAELNRLAGIGSINDAGPEELEVRLRHAERWSARTR